MNQMNQQQDTADTGAKKNLIEKNLIGLTQKSIKVNKNSTENQQKKMSQFQTENKSGNHPALTTLEDLEVMASPVIHKKKRKKKKFKIVKKAQKIEVDFQEEKVDIITNQKSTENLQKMGRPSGTKNKSTVIREYAVSDCLADIIERVELEAEVEAKLDEDLAELNNIENPESEGESKEEVVIIKKKKKRSTNPDRYTDRNRCAANVWKFGDRFGQCGACCQTDDEDADALCKTHAKLTQKVTKKPIIGEFWTERKVEVHGMSDKPWQCMPCIRVGGIEWHSEDFTLSMADIEGVDDEFIPFMGLGKENKDKPLMALYLRENKQKLKSFMKDYRNVMFEHYEKLQSEK